MNCAAIIKETGKRCRKRAVDRGVCGTHYPWSVERTGTLGFNLIVKDEEAVLERCLRSIREIADEIVVTDTGSQDQTIKIALEYADKVLAHKWDNDFSAARNFSIQFSTTDFIGWIDADESLMPNASDTLISTLRNGAKASTIFCAMLSELPDSRVSKHYLPKFFRRGTAHFEAIVHNQLIHSQPILHTDIGFWHTGYNLGGDVMGKKRKRTSTLLRKQLEENPRDAFALMNLGRTLLTNGEYEESLKIAERGLEVEGSPAALRQMLLYNVVVCAANQDDHERAKAACWECLGVNPENVDMLFLLGWLAMLDKQWAHAILFLNRYLEVRKSQETNGFNLLILDFWDAFSQVYDMLGLAHRNLQHWDAAISAYQAATERNPYALNHWKNMAVCFAALDNEVAVRSILWEIINRGIGDYEVWNQIDRAV